MKTTVMQMIKCILYLLEWDLTNRINERQVKIKQKPCEKIMKEIKEMARDKY